MVGHLKQCSNNIISAMINVDNSKMVRKFTIHNETKPFHRRVEPVGGTCGRSPAEVGGW